MDVKKMKMDLDRSDIIRLQEEQSILRKVNNKNPQLFDWLIQYHSSILARRIEKFKKRYHRHPLESTKNPGYECINCPQVFYDELSAQDHANQKSHFILEDQR